MVAIVKLIRAIYLEKKVP